MNEQIPQLNTTGDEVYGETSYNAPLATPEQMLAAQESLSGVISPEDIEDLSGIQSIVERNMDDALEGDRVAEINAISDSLFAADPELEAEFEERVKIAVAEQNTLPFTDMVAQHGRKVLAPLAFAAGIGAVSPAVAGGVRFSDWAPLIGGVIAGTDPRIGHGIERTMQSEDQIRRLEHQQEALWRQYQDIEAQQQRLAQRVNARGVGAQSSRSAEQDIKYEAQKKILELERANIRASYPANPTQAEQVRFNNQILQNQKREINLDAQREISRQREVDQSYSRYDQHDVQYRRLEARKFDIKGRMDVIERQINATRMRAARDVFQGR